MEENDMNVFLGKNATKCFTLNLKHETHNQYTWDNIQKGKEAEKMIQYFLREKWGLPVEGNDLDNNYNNQHGPDIVHEESGFYGEVKNNSGDYYLSFEWCLEHIIPHFPPNARFKVVFVAHDKFTEDARRLLDSENILVAEWGEQLIGQNWRGAISRLYSSLWSIYYRLVDYFVPVSSISNINKNRSSDSSTKTNRIQYKLNDITSNWYYSVDYSINCIECNVVNGNLNPPTNPHDLPRRRYRSWSEIS